MIKEIYVCVGEESKDGVYETIKVKTEPRTDVYDSKSIIEHKVQKGGLFDRYA